MSSSNKVAIITGGTKGIGAACSKLLHSQGWTVVASYGSDTASADALEKELGNDRTLITKSNAGSIADIEKLVEITMQKFGRIDAAVAVAGVGPMIDNDAVTEQDFDRAFDVNVKGSFFLATVGKKMRILAIFRFGRLHLIADPPCKRRRST